MSEGERGRRGGQGGDRNRWWEPWRAVGRATMGPDSGAHRRPLVAAVGRTDCGEEGKSPRGDPTGVLTGTLWWLLRGGQTVGKRAGAQGRHPGQDLTRVLTGALWWLLRGGQTVAKRAGAQDGT